MAKERIFDDFTLNQPVSTLTDDQILRRNKYFADKARERRASNGKPVRKKTKKTNKPNMLDDYRNCPAMVAWRDERAKLLSNPAMTTSQWIEINSRQPLLSVFKEQWRKDHKVPRPGNAVSTILNKPIDKLTPEQLQLRREYELDKAHAKQLAERRKKRKKAKQAKQREEAKATVNNEQRLAELRNKRLNKFHNEHYKKG